MRLRWYLVLLVVATVVPLLAFAGFMVYQHATIHRATVERGLVETARALALALDKHFDTTISALRGLATSEHLDRGDLRAFRRQAQRVQEVHDEWLSISLFDVSGRRLLNTVEPLGAPLPPPPPAMLEPFLRLVATKRPGVSDLFRGPVQRRLVLSIGVPVLREGQVRYVLSTGLDNRALGDILVRQRIPEDWTLTILDRQHVMAARSRDPELIGQKAPPEFVARTQFMPEDAFRGVMHEPVPVYAAYSRSPIYGWTTALAVPAADVDAAFRRTAVVVLGAGIALLSGGVLLAVWVGRRMTRPIGEIVAAAERLGRGETPRPVRSAIREVTGLSTALTAAGQERARAQDALHTTEEQVRQLQKLEAVGQLAGGVAHDFNNLLTIIIGRTQLLLRRLPPDDPIRPDLKVMHQTAERAASLTRQLLAFSRKQILEPKVVDLNTLVPGMASMLERLLGENVALAFHPDTGAGCVKADPGQLEQVVVNLVVNARDAMPDGGRITIETASVELGEHYTRQHVGMEPGSHVMLAVSDTGLGMDAATQARIFEPFFTTKPPDKGTGLGLSTVYGIVKQSGGNIWVYSEPGHGTTFKIYLPRLDEAEDPVEALPVLAERGTETILVAEDEAEVRALAREILQGYGYKVLEASQPTEAVQIAERYAGPINLLVTDVVMPQVSGRTLAEYLTPQRPEMKVLYISGYTDSAIVHHGVLDPGIPFIQKPFTPDGLGRKVREVLEGPATGATSRT
jgi:signal transduction histidine kinase